MLAAQPVTAEQALAAAKALTAPTGCGAAVTGDEIVVCGARRGDAYRLPPSDIRGEPGDLRGRAGEVPSASPDRLPGGPCGIFAGERRCGKKEMELYGYGGGRNPISVVVGIGKALLDPE